MNRAPTCPHAITRANRSPDPRIHNYAAHPYSRFYFRNPRADCATNNILTEFDDRRTARRAASIIYPHNWLHPADSRQLPQILRRQSPDPRDRGLHSAPPSFARTRNSHLRGSHAVDELSGSQSKVSTRAHSCRPASVLLFSRPREVRRAPLRESREGKRIPMAVLRGHCKSIRRVFLFPREYATGRGFNSSSAGYPFRELSARIAV